MGVPWFARVNRVRLALSRSCSCNTYFLRYLAAVGSEGGDVFLLHTNKVGHGDMRGLARTTFHPHDNAIFDVQSTSGDTRLFTASRAECGVRPPRA